MVDAVIAVAGVVQRAKPDGTIEASSAQHRAAAESRAVPAGAFLGLLCRDPQCRPKHWPRRSGDLPGAAPEQMQTAGDLLDGMLAVSRTSILLGADGLLRCGRLLKAADWEPFLVSGPGCGAFGACRNGSGTRSPRPAAGVIAWRATEVRAHVRQSRATAAVARLDAAVADHLRTGLCKVGFTAEDAEGRRETIEH